MDFSRFRQPRLAISCTNSATGGGFPTLSASAARSSASRPACPGSLHALGLFSYRGDVFRSRSPVLVRLGSLASALAAGGPPAGALSRLPPRPPGSAPCRRPCAARPAPVIGDQRRGLLAIGREPPVQHFGAVVVPQRLAPRLHVGDAALDAPEQGSLVDAQFDHRVKRKAPLRQHAVKRHGLRHGAREAVEDEALARIRLLRCAGRRSRPRHRRAPGRRAP